MKKAVLIMAGLMILAFPLFSSGKGDNSIQAITYSFMDSSVPPEYHRSYDIILSKKGITFSVDSYGNILLEKQFPYPEGVSFMDYSTIVKDYKLKTLRMGRKGEECTGGTGEAVAIEYSEGADFYGYNYHCGGVPFGSLRGDIDRLSTDLKALVPDLAGLIESTEGVDF